MLDSYVFWAQLGTVLLAGILIILDQIFGETKFHKIRVVSAVLLIFMNISVTVVADRIAKVADRERKADLKLIQKLDTGLHRLGIEFVMRDVNTPLPIQTIIHLRTWIFLPNLPFPGNLDNYTFFYFSDDAMLDSISFSPPTRMRDYLTKKADFQVHTNTIRMWFYEYGLEFQDKMYWKPESISDLQLLNIKFTMTQNDFGRSQYYTGSADLCPVEQIRIYANEFSDENLLVNTKLISTWNRPGGTNFYGYYPEAAELGADSSDYNFHIDPQWLRQSIVRSLNKQ